MSDGSTGRAARVPFLAVPPAGDPMGLVVALHMMDPPRSEAAMSAALPLTGVPAWRAYLGLPMFGSRMPGDGPEAFRRLLEEDAFVNVLAPVVEGAAAELPGAVASLRDRLGTGESPVALVGGSAGGAAVLLALAETDVPAASVVLVNPVCRVGTVVAMAERLMGLTYAWDDERRARADRLDLVDRASEIADRDPQPPILIVQGDEDEPESLRDADELHAALAGGYGRPDQVRLLRVAALAHALADEPGIEAAPQRPGAAAVDAAATEWLRRVIG